MSDLFVVPTIVSPAQMAANQILRFGNQTVKQLTQFYTANYNAVWANPNATPPEVVTAMGTNAVKVFEASGSLAIFLNSLGADVVATMPTGWNFVANEDGSVTLTSVIVVE